jgi:tRNA(Ile2) C34 agmatinyltransferase TiaS
MLDEVLVGVWEGLTAHHVVRCPVCGGEMHAEFGAHSRPVGGRCKSCGTALN